MQPAIRLPGLRRQLSLAAATVFLLATPGSTLAAQDPLAFDGYAARNDALYGAPVLGGIALTKYEGPVGLRLSGGVHFARARSRDRNGLEYSSGPGIAAWSVDGDFLLAPLRGTPFLRGLLLGFSPYGFVGVGVYGVRDDTSATSASAWSYGAGVRHPLVGPIDVAAEMRERRTLDDSRRITADAERAWEYRVAVGVRFGGRHAVRREAPRRRAEPSLERVRRVEPRPAGAWLVAHILERADGCVGARFRMGGESPARGFDAPGFMRYVFAREGLLLPGSLRQMAAVGREVSTERGTLRPGDLLFFASRGARIDHVALYVGGDRMIHASASGGGVRYDVLGRGPRGEWFAERLLTARRVLGSPRELPDDDAEPRDRVPRPGEPPR